MRYLLDTHAILWYLFGDSRLSDNARNLIDNNDCYFSYASFWEISIKHNEPFDRILISQAINNDLSIITCDEKIPLYDVSTDW